MIIHVVHPPEVLRNLVRFRVKQPRQNSVPRPSPRYNRGALERYTRKIISQCAELTVWEKHSPHVTLITECRNVEVVEKSSDLERIKKCIRLMQFHPNLLNASRGRHWLRRKKKTEPKSQDARQMNSLEDSRKFKI